MSTDKGIFWKSRLPAGTGTCCFVSHRAAVNWAGPEGSVEPIEYDLSPQSAADQEEDTPGKCNERR